MEEEVTEVLADLEKITEKQQVVRKITYYGSPPSVALILLKIGSFVNEFA